MLNKISLLFIFLLFINQVNAQSKKDRKIIKTTRISNAPKIDGILNDEAIYISAMMLDPTPSEIPREFATRDNFSQADFFFSNHKPKG